nr:hypothetical protein [Kibdelosporangium sp. MJ126-NF4]CEL14491.1 hypothetical protein [Kibdelosporangium sp. MJ126-NF4]CTQ88856.1 hypothetical protein [Kibdelosporangium sp. MJ126-NF4]
MTEPDPRIVDAEIVEEPVPPVTAPQFDYTDGGVPNFDYVRDKIEGKYATSVGANELADATPEGQSVEKQFTDREQAGRDKLEEIRRQMRGE